MTSDADIGDLRSWY